MIDFWKAEEQAYFSGWDFSHLDNRMISAPLPWDYAAKVRSMLPSSKKLLDIGTGGGEFLSALQPLPNYTAATEAYPPNIIIARERLAPMNIAVFAVDEDEAHLPFPDASFDLVISRHESYVPAEVYRILEPNAWFITQQVGGNNDIELNEWLGIPANASLAHWNLEYAITGLLQAGFVVSEAQEFFPITRFTDVGAIVYYARIIEWQYPGFTVDKYVDRLQAMQEWIEKHGSLEVKSHRFFIVAQRPR